MAPGFVAREHTHTWQVGFTDADGNAHTSVPLGSARVAAEHIRTRTATGCGEIAVFENWLTVTHTMVDPEAPAPLLEPGPGRSAHYRICYRMHFSTEWLQRIVPTPESVLRGIEYVAKKHPRELVVVLSEIERLERRLTTAEIGDLLSRNGVVRVAGS